MYWKLQENVLSESDIEDMVDFIRTTKRFTQFEKVREFEAAYATWQGSRYAVFVNSGSSANLILISAVKELRGWADTAEVIVPALTWPTTVTPVMQLGLTPVFVDANMSDLGLDYDQLERAITPNTRAIFLAHLLGFPTDIPRIRAIIGDRPIDILEDCCESQGAHIDGTKVGNLGLAGTFSSYWGHHMTTVEGGFVVTDDVELYKLLLLKRSHGLARELPPEMHAEVKAKFPHLEFDFLFLTDGFNVRNTEFSAVIGLRQLAQLDGFVTIRNHNYDRFVEMASRYPKHLTVIDRPGRSSFTFPLICASRDLRTKLQRHFRDNGIESRTLIGGNLLRQPFLANQVATLPLPNAEFLHDNSFYIGNNQYVDDKRMDLLARLLDETFAANPAA